EAVAGRALELAVGVELVEDAAQLAARLGVEVERLGELGHLETGGRRAAQRLKYFLGIDLHVYLKARRALASPPTTSSPSAVMNGAASTSASKVRNQRRRPSGSSA